MKKLRNRVLLVAVLAITYWAILLWAMPALAEGDAAVVTIELVPTPTPTQIPLTPPPALPTPTPRPELPDYDYHIDDLRALSRGLWSVCPASPTQATKLAFCELVQNRVDDSSGDFEDDIGRVLQQGGEFLDYDPRAYRSRENNSIADYAMRSWIFASVVGDRSYRTVPQDGLYCDFYRVNGWDFIKIYNRAGDVVYDSGAQK